MHCCEEGPELPSAVRRMRFVNVCEIDAASDMPVRVFQFMMTDLMMIEILR